MIRLLEFGHQYNFCSQPLILYLNDGQLLEGRGFNGHRSFETKFFAITHIDEERGCLNLRLLQLLKICLNNLVFVPSETCMKIEKDCICGYQFIDGIPLCVLNPLCIKDCMCVPFAILPGHHESLLWKTNADTSLTVCLNLCTKQGFTEGLELKVYKLNKPGYETYPLTQEKQQFQFENCRLITLSKASRENRVKGIFEIEVTGDILYDMVPSLCI